MTFTPLKTMQDTEVQVHVVVNSETDRVNTNVMETEKHSLSDHTFGLHQKPFL